MEFGQPVHEQGATSQHLRREKRTSHAQTLLHMRWSLVNQFMGKERHHSTGVAESNQPYPNFVAYAMEFGQSVHAQRATSQHRVARSEPAMPKLCCICDGIWSIGSCATSDITVRRRGKRTSNAQTLLHMRWDLVNRFMSNERQSRQSTEIAGTAMSKLCPNDNRTGQERLLRPCGQRAQPLAQV
jgi:hypothetical protein